MALIIWEAALRFRHPQFFVTQHSFGESGHKLPKGAWRRHSTIPTLGCESCVLVQQAGYNLAVSLINMNEFILVGRAPSARSRGRPPPLASYPFTKYAE